MRLVSDLKKYGMQGWEKFLALSDVKKALLVCALAVVVIILRRPELIFNPQFWAEDFAVFYQDAYSYGLGSLLRTHAELLQVVQRVIALVLLPLPLRFMPLAYNLVAIAVMTLPLFVLWSDKTLLEKEGPRGKALLTVLFLLTPNMAEIFGNITNTIWYLAIAAALVLIRTETSKKWFIFDCALLFLSGVSGPFAPLLLVVAGFLIITRKAQNKALWIKTGVLTLGALIQIGAYTASQSQSTISLFNQKRVIVENYQKPVEITGMRLFVIPVLGENGATIDIAKSPQAYALGVVGICTVVYGFVKSRREIRALLLFGVLVYASSLFRAQNIPIVQFWEMLQFNTFGERYFFIPFFAWLVLLVSTLTTSKGQMKKFAAGLIVVYLFFFPFSFSVAKLKDFDYQAQVRAYQATAAGEKYCFNINPDESWTTCLKKR